MTSEATSSSANEAHADEPPASREETNTKKRENFVLWCFLIIVVLDIVFSLVLLFPSIPALSRARNDTIDHYTVYGSLMDLSFLAGLRILCAVLGLLRSFVTAQEYPEYNFPLYHPNGDKKSQEELDQEALEEPWWPWFWRFLNRSALGVEFVSVLTEIWAIVKCLVRMNNEIGILSSKLPMHPVFWVVVLVTTLIAFVEANLADSAYRQASKCGRTILQSQPETGSLLRSLSSTLSIPLLAAEQAERDSDNANGDAEAVEDERAPSDIGPDAKSKATIGDLLMLCWPDIHLYFLAFFFLLCAAIAQVYIPRYLGHILDSLEVAFSGNNYGNETSIDDDARSHESMLEVPGFMKNVKLLVIASIAAGVFSGLRGSIFTLVGGRAIIRLRLQLMDALFSQDIGFFDVTKTGDITSRLSSDTTLVGDQVTYNVNVFLRYVVQAIGVLVFMFLVSWQLSIIAFISVPLITILSKWYGNYVRDLTKLMQKKLADGNAVSEAALSSMATVRAFDAAEGELRVVEEHMQKYLSFNLKSSIAYFGYNTFTTSLPELVFAVVVYFGGLMIRNGEMTSGQLVSFLLYLQSLSDAFGAVGWVFSALTRAFGAADKVFELMKREPRYTRPTVRQSRPESASATDTVRGIMGIKASKTRQQRSIGLWPDTIAGNIRMENVELYYPARPKRRVLNGLSLEIKAGEIVALVGKSGGGKSSLMSLIQHLYEPTKGKVFLDGHEVNQLAPEFLSQHVCVVSQEPTLFARSIKRNIIFGLEGTDREPSDEDVAEAARLANAGFIYDFPQKFDTEVGERGVQLSGGQKQRIAIARALVRKPKVLLLDEATSALDAESEHLVQSAIDDMIARGKSSQEAGMTVVIAAHRLSTVRNADKIFVIQDGQLVEQGNHKQLLEEKPDGAYAALIRRQIEAQEKLDAVTTKKEEMPPETVGSDASN